ncbi:GldG family protein [Abditibacterium utsteinense]|nr:GldG family protein [Abditibacterium utsteinense]
MKGNRAPFLSRFSGAFLLASGLFALAALLAFGTFARQTPLGIAFLLSGFACLAAWLVGRFQNRASQKMKGNFPISRDAASRGRTLLAANSLASTLLLGVVLLGVNYFAARHHVTFDLTRNRANSLSDQTLKTLARLPSNLRLTYFYASPQSDPNIQNLLSAYGRASNRVRFESVSALREPSRVPRGFNDAPLIVARLEGTKETAPQEINVPDEQNISSAILKLLDPKARTLYFLSGHGEVAPTQLSALQVALEAQNYSLKTLNLQVKSAKIPADCAALLVLWPQVDLGERDAKMLSTYAGNKGRLLFLLSPARQKLLRFNNLMGSFGLVVRDGFVFDRAYRNPQWPVGVRGDVSRHPILRGVSADCVFPGSVPLQIKPAAPGLRVIFESSSQSQALLPDGKVVAPGPFALAAASERGENRALVCASATIAIGEGLNLFGNKSFLLSSVNWVVGNDALISIPPKAPVQNTLQMPEVAARFASLLCAVILPLLSLGAGVLVWWKRR